MYKEIIPLILPVKGGRIPAVAGRQAEVEDVLKFEDFSAYGYHPGEEIDFSAPSESPKFTGWVSVGSAVRKAAVNREGQRTYLQAESTGKRADGSAGGSAFLQRRFTSTVTDTLMVEFEIRPVRGRTEIIISQDVAGRYAGQAVRIIADVGEKSIALATGREGNHEILLKDVSSDMWYRFELVLDNASKKFNMSLSEFNTRPDGIALPYKKTVEVKFKEFMMHTEGLLYFIVSQPTESEAHITAIAARRSSAIRVRKSFCDIAGHWAKNEIEDIAELGIMEGTLESSGESVFKPDDRVSRAEAVSFVMKAIQLDPAVYDNAYYDVNADAWYAGALQQAADTKIIAEGMTPKRCFRPDAPVTREEMASLIANAYYYKTNKRLGKQEPQFKDADEISSWAKKAVAEAQGFGFIEGDHEGIFMPQKAVTRAETAVMLRKLIIALYNNDFLNGSKMTYIGLAPAPKNDLSLWYRTPAWEERPPRMGEKIDRMFQEYALPIGNGYMGATIFGAPDLERVQYNDKTLWEGVYHDVSEDDKVNNVNRPEQYRQVVKKLLESREYNDEPFIEARRIADRYLTNRKGDILKGSYVNFGSLFIKFPIPEGSVIRNYRRELDLVDGVARVTFEYDGVVYNREFFASYPDRAIAMKLTASRSGAISAQIWHEGSHKNEKSTATENILKVRGTLASNGMVYEAQFKVEAYGANASQRSGGDRIFVNDADAVVIYMTTGTDYDISKFPLFKGEDPGEAVAARLAAAASKGYDAMLATHQADYRELFNRVSFSLGEGKRDIPTDELLSNYKNVGPDKRLETLFFQYGRYLLLSSSRKGSLPANLQGVWNSANNPSWGSGYTVNINLEMNYWPAEVANLAETFLPVIDFMEMLVVPGQRTAKNYYGIDNGGWVFHTNVSPTGFTDPQGEVRYGLIPASGAWMCQNLWDYYEFTRDIEMLRERIYPLIKGAVLFFKEHLVMKDGKWITGPSVSPEQGPMMLGVKMDQQLVYNLFTNFIKASEILDIDHELCNEMKEKQKNMKSPLEIGKSMNGQLMEWDIDIDDKMYYPPDPHRHISHLVALYPLNLINRNTPEYMAAAKKTLNDRGDKATGWSRANKLLLWARAIGDDGSGQNRSNADRAYKIFQGQLTDNTYTNLYDTHPPFQIDGNFGAVAGICELLMQSHLDTIDILPSLPTAWDRGYIKGIVARGAFTVDIEWENHAATRIVVKSGKGNICRLMYHGFNANTLIKEDGRLIRASREGSTIEFPTKAGSVYTIELFN